MGQPSCRSSRARPQWEEATKKERYKEFSEWAGERVRRLQMTPALLGLSHIGAPGGGLQPRARPPPQCLSWEGRGYEDTPPTRHGVIPHTWLCRLINQALGGAGTKMCSRLRKGICGQGLSLMPGVRVKWHWLLLAM